MLTFFIAIIFGLWFRFSAKKAEHRYPLIWAAVGYFTFLGVAVVAAWSIGLAIGGTLADILGSRRARVAVLIVAALGAYTIAALVTALVWRLALQQRPPGWDQRWVGARARIRHTLAMPGPVPWLFAGTYFMLGVLQFFIVNAVMGQFGPGRDLPGADGVQLAHLFGVLVQTIGLTLILWTCRRWLVICLAWASITPLVSIGYFVITSLSRGLFFAPPILAFISHYVVSFLSILIIVLAVRRWGAGLGVLLGACLVAGLVGVLIAFATTLGRIPLPHLAFTTATSLLGNLLLGLALYVGVYAYAERQLLAEHAR